MDRRKLIAGICIAVGIAFMAVPFYYHNKGANETERLLEDFTQAVEEEQNEETADEKEEQTTLSKTDASLFEEGDVIAILEIEELGIKYPVVEGATSSNLNIAVGHLTETAGIGTSGNCVIAGHNGSRYGEYFTHLNEVSVGSEVTLLDKDGIIYTYEVADSFVTDPYDNSIKVQGEETELTLFTCASKGKMRFVVKCVLRE